MHWTQTQSRQLSHPFLCSSFITKHHCLMEASWIQTSALSPQAVPSSSFNISHPSIVTARMAICFPKPDSQHLKDNTGPSDLPWQWSSWLTPTGNLTNTSEPEDLPKERKQTYLSAGMLCQAILTKIFYQTASCLQFLSPEINIYGQHCDGQSACFITFQSTTQILLGQSCWPSIQDTDQIREQHVPRGTAMR